jgi:hypothetical protein
VSAVRVAHLQLSGLTLLGNPTGLDGASTEVVREHRATHTARRTRGGLTVHNLDSCRFARMMEVDTSRHHHSVPERRSLLSSGFVTPLVEAENLRIISEIGVSQDPLNQGHGGDRSPDPGSILH